MKKRRTIYLLLLAMLVVMYPQTALAFSPEDGTKVSQKFAEDPDNTIYTPDGKYVSGKEMDEENRQVLTITYKGLKSLFDREAHKKVIKSITFTTDHGSKKGGTDSVSSNYYINKGDTLYYDNVGYYNGHKLKLAINVVYDCYVVLHIQSGTLEFNNRNSGEEYSAAFYYSIVDESNQLVDDPNLDVLVSNRPISFPTSITTTWGTTILSGIDYSNYTLSGNRVTNVIANSNDSGYFYTENYLAEGIPVNKLSEKPRRSPDPKSNAPMYGKTVTYRYTQDKEMLLTYQLYGSKGKLPKRPVDSTFWFLTNTPAVFPIPYGKPIIENTKNDASVGKDSYHAKLRVSQILPGQSKDPFYPDPFIISVDLKDKANLLDLKNLKNTNFNIKMGDGEDAVDITDRVTTKLTQNNEKLEVILTRDTLKKLDDSYIIIEGLLPLTHDNEEIYKHINSDGYIEIDGLSTHNSKNTGVSSAKLQTKVPLPTGSPIPTGVIEGTKSTDLVPENLVKELKSQLPNDAVEIIGFALDEERVFDKVKDDSIPVRIRSKRIKEAENIIEVPVKVYAQATSELPAVGMATLFLTNIIRCQNIGTVIRLPLTMSLSNCDSFAVC